MIDPAFSSQVDALYRQALQLRSNSDPLLAGHVEGVIGRLSALLATLGHTEPGAHHAEAATPAAQGASAGATESIAGVDDVALPSMRLDGQVAIVTGASGNLGRLAARVFAEAGAHVVAVARNLEKCESTAAMVRGKGRRALAMSVDTLANDQVTAMVERVQKEFGRIDILFNNAGITSPKTLMDSSVEEWTRVVDVNIKGTLHCTKAVLPAMTGQKSGRIINMGSILSRIGMANRTAYTTSKTAIAALTRALAFEAGPYGVTVNALCPTVIVTDLNRELIKKQPELYDGVIRRMPLGRLGLPADIAGPLLFLASPAAFFITGQCLFVDGGYTAG